MQSQTIKRSNIFKAARNPDGTIGMMPMDLEKAYQRAFQRAFISHSAIQGILRIYMEAQGWKRINRHKYNGQNIVDAVYEKGQKTVLVEIKPKLAKIGEIERGLGQTILYLTQGQYAMLVCFSQWKELLTKVYKELNHPKLWLLTYNENGVWEKVIPPTLWLFPTLIK
tara:strand:+ start:1007 stop:1510 length:504 start_codon:yes stop_codon:yes gene_type:complete